MYNLRFGYKIIIIKKIEQYALSAVPELLRDGPVLLFTIVAAFVLSTNMISSEFIHASTSLRKMLKSLQPGNCPRAAFQLPLLKYNSPLTVFEVSYLGFLNQTNL